MDMDTFLKAQVEAFCAAAEREYYAGNHRVALRLMATYDEVNRAFEIPAELQAKVLLTYAKMQLHNTFLENDDYRLVLATLERAAHISGDQAHQAAVLELTGRAYHFHNLSAAEPDFNVPLGYFRQALAINETLDDTRALSESLFHVGLAHQFLDQDDEARDFFTRSYDLAKQHGHKLEQSYAVRHLGFLNTAKGDLNAALNCQQESLDLREEIQVRPLLPFSFIALGDVQMQLEQIEAAEKSYRSALQLASEMHIRRALMMGTMALAGLYEKRQNVTAAREHYQKAHDLAQELGHAGILRRAGERLAALK